MLETIVQHINSKVGSLNLFEQTYGLCNRIVKDGKTFPAEYCNKEYKSVFDFDLHKGVVYHRLTGSIETSESDEDESVSFDPFYERSFPFRTVAVIKKELLNISNDAYIESKVSQDFLSVIASVNNKALRIALGVDSIRFEVEGLTIDRDQVFNEEFTGFDSSFFRYEYLYIAIDYNVIVSGSLSCFNRICENSNISSDYSTDYSIDFS